MQATVAILILVGFESVTAMGGEAKNAKRDIPIAVISSLLIQGAFCYLIEYFCANYFLNSGYPMTSAAGSAAPIGDMMIMVGDALFGMGHGRYFMLAEAITVFLALIGTTLSCMNTGARVTYAMGKDQEVPEHFGMLHDKNLSPRIARFGCLAVISADHRMSLALTWLFGDAGAPTDAAIAGLPHGILVQLRIHLSRQNGGKLPNSLLTVTLGIELWHVPAVHGLSCITCLFCLSQPSQLQGHAPSHNPSVWISGELRLYGLLLNRTVHGVRHGQRASVGPRNRSCLGYLWRNLLHEIQQSFRADNIGHQPYVMV